MTSPVNTDDQYKNNPPSQPKRTSQAHGRTWSQMAKNTGMFVVIINAVALGLLHSPIATFFGGFALLLAKLTGRAG